MHPFTFSFKRIWLRTNLWMRDWFDDFDTTPARADVMLLIGKNRKGVEQNVLHKKLGITSPVISRMLKGMVKDGHIKRWKHPDDKRRMMVALTKEGRETLDILILETLKNGVGEASIESLAPDPYNKTLVAVWMETVRKLLNHLREKLEDTATFRYPCYLKSGRRSPAFPLP